MACDLHIHTTASDGQMTPLEIVAEAKRLGLHAIAITDHDTLAGIKSLKDSGAYPCDAPRLICGIEFSAHMPRHEVHILGLGVALDDRRLDERLQQVRAARWERLDRMLARLKTHGYERVTREKVMAIGGATQSIGRAHIAAVLVEEGYFADVGEAFRQLLHKGGPIYEPHFHLAVEEIRDLVHSVGGLAVLAHPGLVGDDQIVRQVLETGIDGLEVYHPRHAPDQVAKYRSMAEEYNLFVSGGADFHAIPTRFPEKLGVFTVADEQVAGLLNALLK